MDHSKTYIAFFCASIALLYLGGLFFTKTSSELKPSSSRPSPFVALSADAQKKSLLAEEIWLFDDEPVFLSTKWNAMPENSGDSPQVMAEAPLGTFEQKSMFSKMELPEPFEFLQGPPSVFLDVFISKSKGKYASFGESELKAAPLKPQGGRIEIFQTSKAQPLKVIPLNKGVLGPPRSQNWRPARFYVSLNAQGAISLPLKQQGTGVQSLDKILLEYINQNIAFWGLPEGHYQLIIGR